MTPYRGTRIALGTMHAKERAIAKPFRRILEAEVVISTDIDTDAFGTFTGEIERKGTMLDAARAKARLAMQQTGLPLGVASEGSYGPHPYLPFIPGGTELVLFIDEERGIEVKHSFVVTRTNNDSHVCAPGDDIAEALSRMKFPSHAVTVRPNPSSQAKGISSRAGRLLQSSIEAPLFKGLSTSSAVVEAIQTCAALSDDGKALLVPDMRAHLNPTRMAMIRFATTSLVQRIATPCPACVTPGYGIVDVARGLPCADCGMPTQLAVAEIHRCTVCAYESRKPLRRHDERATPGQCEFCNP